MVLERTRGVIGVAARTGLETGKVGWYFLDELGHMAADSHIVPNILTKPARSMVFFGVKRVQDVGHRVLSMGDNEPAMQNVLELWRLPWEREVAEQYRDAKRDGDLQRADELRCLRECLRIAAPECAEEYRQCDEALRKPPQQAIVDRILKPDSRSDT